MKYGVENIKKT